jgi:hypothetical protein
MEQFGIALRKGMAVCQKTILAPELPRALYFENSKTLVKKLKKSEINLHKYLHMSSMCMQCLSIHMLICDLHKRYKSGIKIKFFFILEP